jgi:hypothetical protein
MLNEDAATRTGTVRASHVVDAGAATARPTCGPAMAASASVTINDIIERLLRGCIPSPCCRADSGLSSARRTSPPRGAPILARARTAANADR